MQGFKETNFISQQVNFRSEHSESTLWDLKTERVGIFAFCIRFSLTGNQGQVSFLAVDAATNIGDAERHFKPICELLKFTFGEYINVGSENPTYWGYIFLYNNNSYRFRAPAIYTRSVHSCMSY